LHFGTGERTFNQPFVNVFCRNILHAAEALRRHAIRSGIEKNAPILVRQKFMRSGCARPTMQTKQLNEKAPIAMEEPILTVEERAAINSGRWFSSLSPSLRHDILRCAYVKRFRDGDLITARGEPPEEWLACAKGAIRVSSTSISGKQITLTYVEPGIWFGDVSIFDGDRRTHDAYAHGDSTTLCVAKADFKKILAAHTELYEALLRLHARRIRQLYGLVEDLNTLPLRARLAKQLLYLVRSYGVPSLSDGSEVRISLQLAQEELAQLLGASRQRVNQELKGMEREETIRIEPGGLVIRNRQALLRIAEADS
jgi:CRP-like cAMP-binding protein